MSTTNLLRERSGEASAGPAGRLRETGALSGPTPPARRKRLVLAAAAILVGLHLVKAGLFFAAGQPPLFRDALGYWGFGSQMSEGDWLLLQEKPAFRPPAYPLLIGVCQTFFGTHALVAMAALQQLGVVATVLLSAWLSWRITGSRAAGLIALGLSLVCISRSYLGLYMLSDNLLCLTVILFFASLVLWLERPTPGRAAVVGALLGLSTLVKPVVQFAWLPMLVVMAVRLHERRETRSLVKQGAFLVGSMMLVLLPWLVRNQVCFGRPFLTKSMGRHTWECSLSGEPDDNWLNATLPFAADGPATAQMLAELESAEVNPHKTWEVYYALFGAGHSEIESDDLMLAVGREAMRAQPWRFAYVRAYRCLLYWITSEETFHWYYLEPECGEAVADSVPDKPLAPTAPHIPPTYAGQQTWFSPPCADFLEGLTGCLWWPSRWLYALAAVAVLWSWIVWMERVGPRSLGLAVGLILLYFTLATGIPARPAYRYRMILEPLIVVVFSCALLRWRPDRQGRPADWPPRDLQTQE